jgi:hypothetical protein
VGARKKARQWTESDKTGAEKIGRTVKTKKYTKQTERSNTGKYSSKYRETQQKQNTNEKQNKIKQMNKIQGNQIKHKTKSRTINRRRLGRNLARTPLKKVTMGE